jgi:hypothetical protein
MKKNIEYEYTNTMAHKMMPKVMPTGKKDAKGRMIFRGPKGGLFVRGAKGVKLAPATGNSSRARSPARRAKSPMRR